MSDEIGFEPQELQAQVMESLEEVKEELVQEKYQEKQDRQWFNLIGLSTGILSGLAAVAAMQAGSLANDGMLAQIESTDQWSFYQAKSTKRHLDESTIVILNALQKPTPKILKDEISKITKEQSQIQLKAQRLEEESHKALYRHELFTHSVAALQVGISMGAVSALLRRRIVWYIGLGMATIGIGFMILGLSPVSNHFAKHIETKSVTSQ